MYPPARTFARGHTVRLWALFCLRSDADEVDDDSVLKLLMVVLMMMFYIDICFSGCYGDVGKADDDLCLYEDAVSHAACACIPDDVSEDASCYPPHHHPQHLPHQLPSASKASPSRMPSK